MDSLIKPGWHNRGYLPHYDADAVLQHVVLRGMVNCNLTENGLSTLIESSLLHYDRQRYSLRAWCVMPDHVHVYLVFAPQQQLGSNIRQWKSWITTNWQKRNRSRDLVLEADYFDRYTRTLDQCAQTISYIENNPVSAGVIDSAARWR
jgi:putative transposase